MRAFLKSSEGCFQLKPHTTTIGSRRGADIVLQSAGVADRHAALEFSASDNSFVLQDFNSPQGTFVNSCQVQNAAVGVRPGDILRFGTAGAAFELVLDGAAQVRLGKVPSQGWMLLPLEGCPGKGGWGCLREVAKEGWVGAAARGRLREQEQA
ncbi:FHAD1 protein, partial [Piprites chloris]|nr:FHAD1 protein [Piprites chloris]